MANPPKTKVKPDNPEQYRRFVEMAREVGSEPDQETLDRILGKVARSPKSNPAKPASKSGRAKKR